MATKLNTNNYSKINNDITDLMRTGLYSGAMINIYTDSAGTIFARDGNAPIEHKKISKINTTGAYTINATGEMVNASIEVVFDDGSSFKSFDTIDDYWYTIEGVVFQRRRF
jgi:hypothetical protein